MTTLSPCCYSSMAVKGETALDCVFTPILSAKSITQRALWLITHSQRAIQAEVREGVQMCPYAARHAVYESHKSSSGSLSCPLC